MATACTKAAGHLAFVLPGLHQEKGTKDVYHFWSGVTSSPIILEATRLAHAVRLDWTITECLSDGAFELHRFAPETGNWEILNVQPVDGVCLIGTQYNALDEAPKSGVNLYRVVFRSRSLETIVSGTSGMFFSEPSGRLFQVAGNPVLAGNPLILTLGEIPEPEIQIEIFDFNGAKIWQSGYLNEISFSSVPVHTPDIAAGLYLIRLVSGAQHDSQLVMLGL